MTMTREQAIRCYVESISNGKRMELIQHMNAVDGCFDDVIYYDMNVFDAILGGYTPLEIAQMIWCGDFNPNADLFRFNTYGNLESANLGDAVAAAEDLVDDVINHLVSCYSGDTPWPDLDDLVAADDDTVFNEDYEEVEEDQ